MTPSASWKVLDIDNPDTGTLPRPGAGVSVFAFIATPGGHASGWAPRAAIEIARGWGAEGAKVLLCDLALEAPVLHEVAGLDNVEGISDALLFGSSFQRLGQPLSDGIFLATAGSAVPDGEALRAHPRWRDFAAGFRQAEAVLALYLPADAPGADALLKLVDASVVLGEEGEATDLALPKGLAVLARVGPGSESGPLGSDAATSTAEPTEPAESVPEEQPLPDPVAEDGDPVGGSEVLPDWDVAPEAAEVAPWVGENPPPTLEEILGHQAHQPDELQDWAGPFGPPPEVDRGGSGEGGAAGAPYSYPATVGLRADKRGKKGRVRKVSHAPLLGIISVLIVAALAAGRFGVLSIPGITPAPDAEGVPAEAEGMAGGTGAAAAEERPPESPVAAYAVALGSYTLADSALARASALSQEFRDVIFAVAPVEVDGTPYFRLLAGGAADAGGTEDVRTSLGATLPGSSEWIVRQAGLAFLIGSPGSPEAAQNQVEDLATMGIPGHVLRYRDGNGETSFRVYAGAFANPGEASYLARLLQENQIDTAVLTERRGERP